ncbi:MAG: hypothetical protein P8R42_23550 [Candidatus Binatia bacterium]|nr:hypothetical protein [Candidatus Binatia bacterium]
MKHFSNPTKFMATLGLTALLAACGGGGSDDGGGGENPNPTATPAPAPSPTLERVAVVLTTDFTSSSFATLPVSNPTSVTTDDRTLHSDSIARAHGSVLYVINRFGADNIQALDGTNDYTTLWQCSVGNGKNPQDIVVLGDKGYVALYAGGVAVVNLRPSQDCSDFVIQEIDLSSLADADGFPEANRMVITNGLLYVSLQRLDNFVPTATSMLAVIDTDTDELIDSIELSAPNPFAETKGLLLDPDGKILVAEVGDFGALDGGIERIDPVTATAEGHFITEAELGGNIVDFTLVSDTRGYAVVSDADFNNSLVRFNPSTGELVSTLATGAAYLPDVEYDLVTDQLFLASQDFTNPGIRVFAADDSEVTSSPIDTGLPPFNINFIE